MSITKCFAAAALLMSTVSAQAGAGWQTFADVAGYGLPFLALGYTAARDDLDPGAWQLAYTGATALVLTEGLKYGVNATRPNGGKRGFPSGHTSSAFFAAAYLEDRYGWEVGIPAHLLAASVGYARIHTRDHNFGQVLAGAVIGEATAYFFTSRIDDSVTFLPWADASGGGVGLAMVAKF